MRSDILAACHALEKGEIVAFPTETVYGLGADASNEHAVKRIFEMKNRPSFNPLICHVADAVAASMIAVLDERSLKVIRAFWPGPLTLVLPLKKEANIASAVHANLPTIAVRCPDHPVARFLLQAFQKPIAAPSANKSGTITLLRARDVLESFKEFSDFHILEGHIPYVGLESTILDLSQETPIILRSGFVIAEDIEAVLNEPVQMYQGTNEEEIRAPGMLLRHYAPKRPLKMNVVSPLPTELYLGFGPLNGVLNLSSTSDLVETAQNLYTMIKDLDDLPGDFTSIAVAPIPNEGIGIAINDRLKRASGFYNT